MSCGISYSICVGLIVSVYQGAFCDSGYCCPETIRMKQQQAIGPL